MRKLSTAFAVSSMLLSLSSGCVPVIIGGAVAGGYYVGKDDRKLGVITSDTSITAEINARYIKDDLVKARTIDVEARSGIVTLHGTVLSDAARERAITIARDTQGVKRVISRLSIW